jgi:hypothetical protein
MHGIINYYSAKSGVGSIINNLKKAFDFRSANWHDTSTIPSKGMYVTYLLDDKGRLTDVKSSKYQNISNHPFVNEADFWATIDDAQLEELEEKRREDIVNQRVKELELHTITSIELSKQPEECIKLVFSNHYDVLEQNSEIMEGERKFEFDYAILKRFLEKTILQLTTLDKRISADEFLELKQIIVEVEYLQGLLNKVADPESVELTKQYFLKYQIEYSAIKKAGGNLNDNINMLINRVKNLEAEIKALPNRIQNASGSDRARFEEELSRKIKEKATIESELNPKRPVIENIKQLIHEFEKQYIVAFPKMYFEQKEQLKVSIKKLLNRLADNLDTALYQKATESDVIAMNFYSQNIDSTFSTMTFVRYYIARLNKDLMQEADKVFYNLLTQYERTMIVRVAIITEDHTFGQNVKLAVLAQSKHMKAVLYLRAIEFITICDREAFALVLVDTKLRGADVLEVIQKGKASAKNERAEYIVFDS